MGGSIRHKRKKRRQNRARDKFGQKAKPKHTALSGRTGTAHSKKMKSKQPKR